MINIDDILFLKNQFTKITDSKQFILPSEWIEKNRYLSSEISRKSGYYRFENSPFWKEPLDNLSPLSSIEKIAICKGVQTGATVGVAENFEAYKIGCDPAPVLHITADEELLKKRFAIHLENLIDGCHLRHLIFDQSGNKKNKRTGDTMVMKTYRGGYIWGIGSNNKNKVRSMPFPNIVMDEIETFQDSKKEGTTESLAENRSNTFVGKRKLLYISTPLVLQNSKIWRLFKKGDQRYFFVPCIHCGEYQTLEWHGFDDNNERYGIIFDIDENYLPIYSSVRYKCKYCGKLMKNSDKAIFMQKGEWKATAEAIEPNMISYHLNSLYSMPGFYSWENIVSDWKDAWDLKINKVKDIAKFREFRNLKLGLPFKEQGEQIRREKVNQFRNPHYLKNQINNKQFKKDSGSEILFLTCSVDVQKIELWVHIIGWCVGGRNYTIDVFSIPGDVQNIKGEVWFELDKLLTQKEWPSDDGKTYRIIHTCIDSGWGENTGVVYEFCKQYSSGVIPVKGRDWIDGGLTYKSFAKTTLEKAGISTAFNVNTTKNKDKIAKMFNLQWNTGKMQPEWFPNFAWDIRDDILDQFESERKIHEYDKYDNWVRSIWRQIPGRDNHIFDTMDYNLAGLEMVADYFCRESLFLKYLDWNKFWELAKTGIFYREI